MPFGVKRYHLGVSAKFIGTGIGRDPSSHAAPVRPESVYLNLSEEPLRQRDGPTHDGAGATEQVEQLCGGVLEYVTEAHVVVEKDSRVCVERQATDEVIDGREVDEFHV